MPASATPLIDPGIEHTIGIVASAGAQPTPVVSELLALCAPLELDDDEVGQSAKLNDG